jgi:glycerophosphoryl diester phosphodiesterase
MRFTPQLRDLKWLVARPIAHRGLHNDSAIENTKSAFAAALTHNYAIECDLQITKDDEAVVFHDDGIDRLLDGKGLVKDFTLKELKSKTFKAGKDRVQSLDELLEQVSGAQTLVIELKSHWDGDQALTHRALEVLRLYKGPYALMSFDPEMIACIAERVPHTVRGITADRVVDAYYNTLPLAHRLAMRSFEHLHETRPHFVSFDFKGLPFAPITAIRNAGHPVITWTIESEADAAVALRYSDQITFQGFHPA